MSKSINDILKTEYSEKFDEIRKNMMVISYFKYGEMKENYEKFKCMDALGNIEKRIQKYIETGNTEFLADVANFAMIEFMYPSIQGARYTPTDSGAVIFQVLVLMKLGILISRKGETRLFSRSISNWA